MQRIALLLLIIAAFAYAIPSEVQHQAGAILGAERSLVRTSTYQITIQKEIIPGLSEIVGRKYTVNLTQNLNGVFLNENGTLWMQNTAPAKDAQIQTALEQIEPLVVADIANIEHIKKYGHEKNE